jgi:hypothetical protein
MVAAAHHPQAARPAPGTLTASDLITGFPAIRQRRWTWLPRSATLNVARGCERLGGAVSGYANNGSAGKTAESAGPDGRWTAGLVALVVLIVALAVGDLIFTVAKSVGRSSAHLTAAQAAPRPAAKISASPAPAASATTRPASGAAAAGLLAVASATADGPGGTSDGDHPNLAAGIIHGGDGQAWQSNWYATPAFGELKSGTGLVLDMGETVNLSRVQLVLGTSVGADVQVRVGNTSLPGELPVAASASDVGGTVQLRLNTPASGRYVLIWFTQLPPDSQGKYQVTVRSAAVYGTKRTLFVAPGIKSSSKRDAIRSYSINIQS